MHIELIAAVRNEEACLPRFVSHVTALALPPSVRLSVLFVEDGSTDGTVAILRQLAADHASVSFISLVKGFGQCRALVFGMQCSEADAVIMMDVDDGHPVHVIPEMIARFMDGAEIVQAVRAALHSRKAYRRIGSRLFNLSMRVVTGEDIDRQNVYFRLVSRRIKNRIIRNRRWHCFLRLNLSGRHAPPAERVRFVAGDRQQGRSKYGFLRLLAFSVNGLLSLIPVARFGALLVAGAVVCVLLRQYSHGIPSVAVALAGGSLLGRYVALCNDRTVDRMQVKERS